mgnify:CR=1 FL=1
MQKEYTISDLIEELKQYPQNKVIKIKNDCADYGVTYSEPVINNELVDFLFIE